MQPACGSIGYLDIEPEDDYLNHIIRELHRSLNRALQARLTPYGISVPQWQYMRVLWAQDGITHRDLSIRTGMTEPTTSLAINILERRHLVQRVRDAGDHRKVSIYLTRQGHDLRDQLVSVGQDVEQEATANIPQASLGTMFSVLRQIQDNLAETPENR